MSGQESVCRDGTWRFARDSKSSRTFLVALLVLVQCSVQHCIALETPAIVSVSLTLICSNGPYCLAKCSERIFLY